MKKTSELMKIPGVGAKTAEDFNRLGIYKINELSKYNPEDLYSRLCELYGTKIDRCVLYVFRCAVYFASRKTHDPEKLKWWNWKD